MFSYGWDGTPQRLTPFQHCLALLSVQQPKHTAHCKRANTLAKASGFFFGVCNCLNQVPGGWFLSLYTHCKDSWGWYLGGGWRGMSLVKMFGGRAHWDPEPTGKILMHLCQQGYYTLKSRIDDWSRPQLVKRMFCVCVCACVCVCVCVCVFSLC